MIYLVVIFVLYNYVEGIGYVFVVCYINILYLWYIYLFMYVKIMNIYVGGVIVYYINRVIWYRN